MKRTLLVFACLSALSLAALAAEDEKTNPDNTATNERDRSSETQTSGDQSNSSSVKIITANGQVTLRGPVKTAQEKSKIDQLARSAASSAKIENQLDVKY